MLIKGVPFTIIGTLTAKGQSGAGQDQDDTVLIPYTSALQRLTGGTTIGTLMVSAVDAAHIEARAERDHRAARAAPRHRRPGQPDDFSVRNLADIASAASATASILGLLLAAVAAVSLIVGGIGIMNIMLVSVTERTREIGLRVALGARSAAILRQFLIEAVVLSTGGGAIGVVLGVAGAAAIAVFAHWPASVPLTRRAARARLQRRGRRVLRLLAGPQSRRARPDPRAAVRVMAAIGGGHARLLASSNRS